MAEASSFWFEAETHDDDIIDGADVVSPTVVGGVEVSHLVFHRLVGDVLEHCRKAFCGELLRCLLVDCRAWRLAIF